MGSVSMDNGDIIGILDLTLLDRGRQRRTCPDCAKGRSPMALLLSASFRSTLDSSGAFSQKR